MIQNPEINEIKKSLLGKVPEPVLELAGSEETASQIAQICSDNEVESKEEIEQTALQIGLVLLGKLNPEKLTDALKKEADLDPQTAERVYLEVNRLIFSQVRGELAKMYKKEEEGKSKIRKDSLPPKEETQGSSKNDTYREPIE